MKYWRIITPGLSSTFQDAGRFNQAHLGIPVSGALDLPAAQWVNRLLGNDINQAVIEITLTGLSFETNCDCSIAITGAVFVCSINNQTIDHEQTIILKAGDVFAMTKIKSGARAYLAVAGGFNIPQVLGSYSTLSSAQMGGFHGRSLQAGDEIKLNKPHSTPTRSIAVWKRPKGQSSPTQWPVQRSDKSSKFHPQSHTFRQLVNNRIDMTLHNFQFILLIISNNLKNNILHCLNKILKGHLILITLVPHNLDKDEVVILLGDLRRGHSCKL